MQEKPILFSGEMVRGILEDRKLETRRVVNRDWWDVCARGSAQIVCNDAGVLPCPYGAPGDRLWVRETWGIDEPGLLKRCNGKVRLYMDGGTLDHHYKVLYRATQTIDPDYPMYWRPSIFMPRWASRLTLEVTGVRVERLQDIGGYSSLPAEGCLPRHICGGERDVLVRDYWVKLWDSINAKRGYTFASNPWVWVIQFRKIDA